MKLLLTGDVMTGRGIDQILKQPVDPILYESWAKSALDYVRLAERRHGPVPRPVPGDYIWGDALDVFEETGPAARVINLETSVTDRGKPWPDKGIHYRMHPDNVDCLEVADIDCCVLSNNHTLDWSREGLEQTLATMAAHGLTVAGAGLSAASARAVAAIPRDDGTRVLVAAVAMTSSGVPATWAAGPERPGVAFFESPGKEAVDTLADQISAVAAEGDIVIVSIHWGPNWGYEIPNSHRRFAHALIDEAGAHIVHGHSSHHPLGIEVYRDRPIIYGCGDLINDYEGIGGHEEFRPDLRVLYLVELDQASGRLDSLDLFTLQSRRFRLERAPGESVRWLGSTLSDRGHELGTRVVVSDGRLSLNW